MFPATKSKYARAMGEVRLELLHLVGLTAVPGQGLGEEAAGPNSDTWQDTPLHRQRL